MTLDRIFPRTDMLKEAKEAKAKPHSMFIEILIFIGIFIVYGMVQSLVVSVAQMIIIFTDDKISAMLSQGLTVDNITDVSGVFGKMTELINEVMTNLPPSFWIVSLVTTAFAFPVVFFYVRKIEKRSYKSMGFSKKNALPEYLVGLLIGAVLFTVPVLICILSGNMTWNGISANFSAGLVLVFFLCFVIQGASEEVLCRSYFMMSLTRRYNVMIAAIANSVVFAALHIFNNGVGFLPLLNIALFGMFSSIYILKRGNIWGALAIHSVWNFVQGNIYGISVSGTPALPSVFSVTQSAGAVKIVTGGSFGLEGGLAVTATLILAVVAVFFIPTKKSELRPVTEEELKAAEEEKARQLLIEQQKQQRAQGYYPQNGQQYPPQGYYPQNGQQYPPQGYYPQNGQQYPPQGYYPQNGQQYPPQGYYPQNGQPYPPQGQFNNGKAAPVSDKNAVRADFPKSDGEADKNTAEQPVNTEEKKKD